MAVAANVSLDRMICVFLGSLCSHKDCRSSLPTLLPLYCFTSSSTEHGNQALVLSVVIRFGCFTHEQTLNKLLLQFLVGVILEQVLDKLKSVSPPD